MRPIFCATTGTVLEIMLKKASHYYGYLLGGTNRCAEIWMCFSHVFASLGHDILFNLLFSCTCPNQLARRCTGLPA